MPNIRNRSVVIRGNKRRSTVWTASADVDAVSNLAAATKALHQSLPAATILAAIGFPCTVVRTRGSVWVRSDQIAGSEVPFGAVGMMVANQNALTAGAASLLGPITNEDSDNWFMHQFWFGGLVFASAIGLHGSDMWYRFDFDSKAQRKLEDGDGLATMIENGSATHGCTFLMKFRILFKTT